MSSWRGSKLNPMAGVLPGQWCLARIAIETQGFVPAMIHQTYSIDQTPSCHVAPRPHDSFDQFISSGRPLSVEAEWVPSELRWHVTVIRRCGSDMCSRQAWRSPAGWSGNRADISRMMAHEVFSEPSRAVAQGWRPVGGQPIHL